MFIGHSQSQELHVQHIVLSARDTSWMIRRTRGLMVAYMLTASEVSGKNPRIDQAIRCDPPETPG
jgi:hypothetical protein